ncbi:hypothetical protein LKO27_09615 [Tessaracoccus sp. OS52]|uniref:hypothetical protein n=1 Tax=Tessaracoccus sp. OS52 TaxID=2886691 RepID=UPI001D12907D|nr:hypothetical protein [Tessaracoccus sp. OS52]MCC2593660.1 hypothetical protein [Tessaracoccus sp. OS52]
MLADAMLSRVMTAFGAAEKVAASSYEYPQVQQELSELRAAVMSAIQQDDNEAESFWTDLSRLATHTVNFFSERNRFNREANAVKSQALQALGRVESVCAARVGVHAGVPAQLDSDAEGWQQRARKVRQMRNDARRLRDVAGWEGLAHDQYTAAATVQINALSELEGIMISTGNGCTAGASLNRAIFYVVGKSIRQAAARIRSTPGSGGGQYYRRTSTARNECSSLLGEIMRAAGGEVAAGSIQSLSGELAKTVSLPNLLRVGSWPTGTTGADTTPANTADAVRPHGGDTNLNTGRGSGGNAPGVRL